jgi:hypothetical protein
MTGMVEFSESRSDNPNEAFSKVICAKLLRVEANSTGFKIADVLKLIDSLDHIFRRLTVEKHAGFAWYYSVPDTPATICYYWCTARLRFYWCYPEILFRGENERSCVR